MCCVLLRNDYLTFQFIRHKTHINVEVKHGVCANVLKETAVGRLYLKFK